MNDCLLEVEPGDLSPEEQAVHVIRRCAARGVPIEKRARCPIHRKRDNARQNRNRGLTMDVTLTFEDFERDQRARGRR